MTKELNIIGIDLGGTSIRVGLVQNGELLKTVSSPTPSNGSEEDVLEAICELIGSISVVPVAAIGIGVPSVVDVKRGIVYDVVNIPQWKEVHLKAFLEKRFQIPVFVNNDANCFAAGEKFFGKGRSYESLAGLVLGTGLGAGLILRNRLYEGNNCGAGEIGYLPYLNQNFEYYCSGQYFKAEHDTTAFDAYSRAIDGDSNALAMFRQFGHHVGNMLLAVIYTYDPELIVLGGSVSKSIALFEETMMQALQKCIFIKTLENLRIEVSETEHIALYGAASLYFNSLGDPNL